MEKGWIKLHNKFLDWEWSDNPNMVHVFIHLLLRANYKESTWQGFKIGRGQLVVGRRKLAKTLGLSEREIRTSLFRLKSTHEIAIKTTNRFSIITLINWDKYQGREENRPTERPTKSPTNDQQTTTSKEVKKLRSNTGEEKSSPGIPLIIDLFKDVNPAYKKWFGNKTQRKAVDNLLERYGFEKLQKVIALLPKTNKIMYLPTITTPLQLEDKWAALEAGLTKEKNKIINNHTGIA